MVVSSPGVAAGTQRETIAKTTRAVKTLAMPCLFHLQNLVVANGKSGVLCGYLAYSVTKPKANALPSDFTTTLFFQEPPRFS